MKTKINIWDLPYYKNPEINNGSIMTGDRFYDLVKLLEEYLACKTQTIFKERGIKYYSSAKYKDKSDSHSKNSEYGYYISRGIYPLYVFLKTHKIKNFCDFGCGAGVMLQVLHEVIPYEINFYGIDNEQEYIDVSKEICTSHINTKLGDICEVSKEDFEKYDCIYMWEPFLDSNAGKILAYKMVENMIQNMKKGTFVLHRRSGMYIFNAFCDNEIHFDIYRSEGFHLYIKK